MNTELLMYLFTRATTDENGRAAIGSLLPGVYRAIAFPEDAQWMSDPNLFQRLVQGQEVKIGAIAPTLVQVRTEEIR